MRPSQRIYQAVCSRIIGRDTEVEAVLLGILSRRHVMFVGPPGVAKSMLCRSIASSVAGARYCERLLSGTTPPEDVFGPVDIPALTKGQFVRNGEHYAQTADLLFLDEFFRASPAIRDALLHLLGEERQTLIDGVQVKVPLISAVGAANAWDDSADQSAILDRWTIRLTVKQLPSTLWDDLLFNRDETPVPQVCDLQELKDEIAQASAIPFSQKAKEALREILDKLEAEGVNPSDRRKVQCISVAKAAASMAGADEVLPEHLEPLCHVLWDVPGDAVRIAEKVIMSVCNPIGGRAIELMAQFVEIAKEAKATDTSTRLAALKKLDELATETKKLEKMEPNNRRVRKLDHAISQERLRLKAVIMGADANDIAMLLQKAKREAANG